MTPEIAEALANALRDSLDAFAEKRKCFISNCRICARHDEVRNNANTALENYYAARNRPFDSPVDNVLPFAQVGEQKDVHGSIPNDPS